MKLFTTIGSVFCALVAFSQTTIDHTLQHGGLTREYRLYIPASYDGTESVPLLFNLHGYTSNNVQQEVYADFRPIADTANFIIVHPNGTLDLGGNRYWNAFNIPGGVDDVGFLSTLIDEISQSYTIDMNRVYSTGMSNGGFMSYELACALGYRITAVASVTGAMPKNRPSTCNPPHPVPAMQIHGTADPTVPYNGNAQQESIEDVVDYWVGQTGCNPVPVVTQVPDVNTTDGCTAEQYVYSGGIGGATVEFFKIQGGGHTWPGAPIDIGVTNHDFDASVEIWRFFSKYKTTDLVSFEEQEEAVEFTLYPNPTEGSYTLGGAVETIRSVRVLDTSGKVIETYDGNAIPAELEVKQSGMYFVQIETVVDTIIRKLIVR